MPSRFERNPPMSGKVYKYGDNVNTDEIIPARYLNTSDPAELASHCMEDIDADFMKNLEPGDFIVAGSNFGCGSSREHAPIAIKEAGVAAVIASTFARIFFRNAINLGLPVLNFHINPIQLFFELRQIVHGIVYFKRFPGKPI